MDKKKIFFFKGTRHNCDKEFDELKELDKGIKTKITNRIQLKKSDEPVLYDSLYELKILKELDKSKFVKKIKTQSYEIDYKPLHTKKIKKYYPDIQILTTQNELVLMEVKDFKGMVNKHSLQKHKFLRKHCEENGYGHIITDPNYYTFEDLKKEIVSEKIQKAFIDFVASKGAVTFTECKQFKNDNNITDKQICHIIWNNKRRLGYKQHKIIFKKQNIV